MLGVFVLLLATTFIDPIMGLLQQVSSNWLPEWINDVINTTTPFLISLGLSILLFVVLFRMLPHERLSRKTIMVSSMTTVVLIQLMRQVFAYYMEHVSSIGTLYGTYAFIVGISLWIYYVSLAFMIGAETGWLYRERNEPQPNALTETVAHPGPAAITPEAVEAYDQEKSSPMRPVGDDKEPPKIS
jgi:membrane protein